ncbi:MAG: hypothetical protein NT121_17340 [Chloroflexi bacterium]|nr:hypothetical protein [Chloroflexota bacterium]
MVVELVETKKLSPGRPGRKTIITKPFSRPFAEVIVEEKKSFDYAFSHLWKPS